MAISNRELRKFLTSKNRVISALAAEVLRHRDDMAVTHRRMAELVRPISQEASSAIREHAQDVQCLYAVGADPMKDSA